MLANRQGAGLPDRLPASLQASNALGTLQITADCKATPPGAGLHRHPDARFEGGAVPFPVALLTHQRQATRVLAVDEGPLQPLLDRFGAIEGQEPPGSASCWPGSATWPASAPSGAPQRSQLSGRRLGGRLPVIPADGRRRSGRAHRYAWASRSAWASPSRPRPPGRRPRRGSAPPWRASRRPPAAAGVARRPAARVVGLTRVCPGELPRSCALDRRTRTIGRDDDGRSSTGWAELRPHRRGRFRFVGQRYVPTRRSGRGGPALLEIRGEELV
ncbi:MAG: hypothetical protein R3F43_11590 [bacterium]